MRFLILGFSLLAAALAVDAGVRQRAAAADSTVEPSTRDSGFSHSGIESIDRMLQSAVDEKRISAGIALLARDGEIVWLGTAGEMAPGVPMRDDAILPLASVGKLFTATAAMILCERGVLSLDDPVSKYIPEFADARVGVSDAAGEMTLVPADTPITILNLLTHTGGLIVDGDRFWSIWDRHVGQTTTTDFARDLVKLPLNAQPGDEFAYGQTGASYEVLGAVIEIASGQTLEAFMHENIFEPLDLEDSYFYLPQEKSSRLPAVYRRVDGELQLDRERGEDVSRSTFFHGGGGVRSAPADILRFSRLFLEGGTVDGVQLLKPETIALMMQDQLGDRVPERWQRRGLSWGFGGAVGYADSAAGYDSSQTYGWAGGGSASLWVDPVSGIAAYFAFPLTPPGDYDLLDEFKRRVYAAMDTGTAPD